jgi:hypothetical protein
MKKLKMTKKFQVKKVNIWRLTADFSIFLQKKSSKILKMWKIPFWDMEKNKLSWTCEKNLS